MTTDYIQVDVWNREVVPKIQLVQNDTGRNIEINVGMGNLNNYTVRAYMQKPDGTRVYNTAEISSDLNGVVVSPTLQMVAIAGQAQLQVEILDGAKRVSTFAIDVDIAPSLVDEGAIPSTDEFGVLEEAIENANEAAENANAAAENADEAADRIITDLYQTNAYSHNSHFRGKNFGSEVTAEQYAAIADGTFKDMYIGDGWTINGTTYLIAAFNYYMFTGDVICNTNHITLVPYFAIGSNQKMNDTNTTTGGYVNSLMRTQNMEEAKTIIKNAFGAEHILTHRRYLTNATNNGVANAGAWYDSDIELMTEQNVYGGIIYDGYVNNGNWVERRDIDCTQYPLFVFQSIAMHASRSFWLRNVASATNFSACFSNGGYAGYPSAVLASTAYGVRPAFSIKA